MRRDFIGSGAYDTTWCAVDDYETEEMQSGEETTGVFPFHSSVHSTVPSYLLRFKYQMHSLDLLSWAFMEPIA